MENQGATIRWGIISTFCSGWEGGEILDALHWRRDFLFSFNEILKIVHVSEGPVQNKTDQSQNQGTGPIKEIFMGPVP